MGLYPTSVSRFFISVLQNTRPAEAGRDVWKEGYGNNPVRLSDQAP